MDFVYETLTDFRAGFQALMQAIGAAASAGGCEIMILSLDEISWKQRKLLNALCGDISKQVRLNDQGQYVHITDAPFGRKLSKDSWRGIFMAITLGQESVPNPEGDGFIVLSRSSKRMAKSKFSDCVELIASFGAHRQVVWGNPRWQYEEDMAALTNRRTPIEYRSDAA